MPLKIYIPFFFKAFFMKNISHFIYIQYRFHSNTSIIQVIQMRLINVLWRKSICVRKKMHILCLLWKKATFINNLKSLVLVSHDLLSYDVLWQKTLIIRKIMNKYQIKLNKLWHTQMKNTIVRYYSRVYYYLEKAVLSLMIV